MEGEDSAFESSEMLATFLGSSPLLWESWKLCERGNVEAAHSFVADQIGEVIYVAFSGVQNFDELNPNSSNLVPLDKACFPVLCGHGQDEEPVMVHAGFLSLFHSMYNNTNFLNQMHCIMEKRKPIVFTGHSIGGTIASLSALWLLSYLQSILSPVPVLCITFGSPLLGNQLLSRAILRERWGGSFCHMVTKNDIVPRLLFAPLAPLSPLLHSLLQLWQFYMTSPLYYGELTTQLSNHEIAKLFHFVLSCNEEMARGEGVRGSSFWPFGNFLLCGNEGAVCVDDGSVVVKLLHVMLAKGSFSSCVEDHLKYEEYVQKVSFQFFTRRKFMEGELSESSYEAGLALALQSSGIAIQEPIFGPAKDCLKMAKRMGCAPNLISASLAIRLSKITPLRAQTEWYKASCDESDDQMGYYDSFKQRGASRRGSKINMNRLKLAGFWDDLIIKLETNQLPYDFHKREKWVNASQFYKLLVEPLDIAEYYRSGMHWKKGHYIKHGRERRYEIFDRWWRERRVAEEENNKRSRFASLTQDSCFWATLEEAREWLENVRSESDPRKFSLLWENIDKFEHYSRRMVERKEVSIDVVLKNSSYSVWVDELRELKLQLQIFPPRFPSFMDGGEVAP